MITYQTLHVCIIQESEKKAFLAFLSEITHPPTHGLFVGVGKIPRKQDSSSTNKYNKLINPTIKILDNRDACV